MRAPARGIAATGEFGALRITSSSGTTPATEYKPQRAASPAPNEVAATSRA
ncbi:MAG: hypothetical protein WCP28_02265 [Actinomycetes bacterium]